MTTTLILVTGCRARPEPNLQATVAGQVAVAVAATLASLPDATPAPTWTAYPTLTPYPTFTPYPTRPPLPPPVEPTSRPAQAVTPACRLAGGLTDYYTGQSGRLRSARAGAIFAMNWVLANEGDCPWPESASWRYQAGEPFGQDGPLRLATSVAAGGQALLTSPLRAPAAPGHYRSFWLLEGEDGAVLAGPLAFEILVVAPSPTAVSGPPPATAEVTTLDFNIFIELCEYVGSNDWRCLVTVTPFGGGGGPYTVWVFDSTPPARYFGPGNQQHWAQSRRCAPWVHEIKVQDDASGRQLSRDHYLDPQSPAFAAHFPAGACREP